MQCDRLPPCSHRAFDPDNAGRDRPPAYRAWPSRPSCLLRPFVLPIMDKAGPVPCQGFAAAGQTAPALDTAPALPNATGMRTKGLPEGPSRMERVN